jgi:hypothetical protein
MIDEASVIPFNDVQWEWLSNKAPLFNNDCKTLNDEMIHNCYVYFNKTQYSWQTLSSDLTLIIPLNYDYAILYRKLSPIFRQSAPRRCQAVAFVFVTLAASKGKKYLDWKKRKIMNVVLFFNSPSHGLVQFQRFSNVRPDLRVSRAVHKIKWCRSLVHNQCN